MLVLQQVVVTVDRACDVALSCGVDPIAVPGMWEDRRTRARGTTEDPVDGSLLWQSFGRLGKAGAAYVTQFSGAKAERATERNELKPLETRYAFRAHAGRRYRLRQISALVADVMHSQPNLQAVRLVHGRGRVVLGGAPARWQALVDAAFFYLHTSVHPSTPTSTYIFGLAYWPDYPLLPRSRDVGRRDVPRSATPSHAAGGGSHFARVPRGPEATVPIATVLQRELWVTGTFRYANTYPAAIALAASVKVDLAGLVTERFGVEEIGAALRASRERPASVKPLVLPGEERLHGA